MAESLSRNSKEAHMGGPMPAVDSLDRPLNELRDGLLAAAKRQTEEDTMNTVMPTPRPDVRSMLSIPEGDRFVIVDYRDSSDHGRAQEFYDTEAGARVRADALIADPPGGNYFHPAPKELDLRIYAVERLVPALRPARSCCVNVIAEAAADLRNVNWHNNDWGQAADFIERRFGRLPADGQDALDA